MFSRISKNLKREEIRIDVISRSFLHRSGHFLGAGARIVAKVERRKKREEFKESDPELGKMWAWGSILSFVATSWVPKPTKVRVLGAVRFLKRSDFCPQ
jgi:single-stranded DNA-binding protein